MKITTHGRFRRRSEQVEGVYVTYQVAKCAICNWEALLRDGSAGGLPPEMASNKFRQRGWVIGQSASNDICPKCSEAAGVRKPRAPLSPQQKRAAYCKIAGVKRAEPKESKMPAETPKGPSIADRRRVMDGLEEHYDTDAGRYTQSWSDKALASKLTVPHAWVTEIRESFFGLGAGSEAETLRDAAIQALEEKLEAAMHGLATIEAELRRVKLDRSYAA